MELVRPLLITGWVVGPQPIFLQLCWMPMTWNLDEPPGTSRVEKRTHCDGDTFGWKKRPKRGGWTFYVDKKKSGWWWMWKLLCYMLFCFFETQRIHVYMYGIYVNTYIIPSKIDHSSIGNTIHGSYGWWVKESKCYRCELMVLVLWQTLILLYLHWHIQAWYKMTPEMNLYTALFACRKSMNQHVTW